VRSYDLRFPSSDAVGHFEPSDELGVCYGVTSVAYSRDGTQFLASYSGDDIFLFDCKTDSNRSYSLSLKRESLENYMTDSKYSSHEEDIVDNEVDGEYQSLLFWQLRWEFGHGNQVSDVDASESEDSSEDLEFDLQERIPVFDSRQSYSGHLNMQTVKEACFLGLRSEFIASGSDDGNLYIWDRKTAQILACIKSDDNVVNSIHGHPMNYDVLVSGIDDTVKILAP
jgi:WD40 repeat protein